MMSTTSFNDLPEETTTEILLKLSVKDLIRSTTVNKSWYSLINNPSFISSQIRKAISSCDDNAVLIMPPSTSRQTYCSLISADTSRVIENFDIPLDTKFRRLKLVSHIDGMVLLAHYHVHIMTDLYLWNPYVRLYRVLVSENKSDCVAGMGFDKVNDDYKVIRIVYVRSTAAEAEIYSFRKNAWRKIDNPGVPTLVVEDGVYVDGCYYWLAAYQCITNKPRVIISFDFRSEVFREFQGPDDVPDDGPICWGTNYSYHLMRFEDSLVLSVLDVKFWNAAHGPFWNEAETIPYWASFPYCIWLMRQENGLDMWTPHFRGLLKQFGFPLAITNNGILLLESYHPEYKERYVVSCKLSMIHEGHGFLIIARFPKKRPVVAAAMSVGTSFAESLIMYEGGIMYDGGKIKKSFTLSLLLNKLLKMLKYAKQAIVSLLRV